MINSPLGILRRHRKFLLFFNLKGDANLKLYLLRSKETDRREQNKTEIIIQKRIIIKKIIMAEGLITEEVQRRIEKFKKIQRKKIIR